MLRPPGELSSVNPGIQDQMRRTTGLFQEVWLRMHRFPADYRQTVGQNFGRTQESVRRQTYSIGSQRTATTQTSAANELQTENDEE